MELACSGGQEGNCKTRRRPKKRKRDVGGKREKGDARQLESGKTRFISKVKAAIKKLLPRKCRMQGSL